nr:hypothetical protein [Tanacetum cinerariifolium]
MPPRRSNRVNNEADPAFTVAVAQVVTDLLPTLTARTTDEIRQNENNGNNGNRRNARRVNTEGSGNDGDAQPTDIHVWLERFRKEKPQNFSSTSTPVEVENWISHIEKIFEVLGCDDQFKARLATYKLEGDAHSCWRCEREYKSIRQLAEETSIDFMKRFLRLAGFLGTKAGTQEEQAKNFKWGLNDFIKNEEDNKRDRDDHRIRPSETSSQGSNPRAGDRRDSDKYGNRGRHGNRDKYGTDRWRGDRQGSGRQGNDSQKAWRDQDQHVQGQHYSRSYGSSSQMGYSDYNSSPPCNLCGKFHPGKACHRATGACFKCGEVGHLAKDCKKGSTSSGEKMIWYVFV